MDKLENQPTAVNDKTYVQWQIAQAKAAQRRKVAGLKPRLDFVNNRGE